MKRLSPLYDIVFPKLKDKLVFDIGSANGSMTRTFVKFGASVVAIDPQDCPNRAFPKKNVTKVQVALSDHEGYATFYRCKKSPLISTCLYEWTQGLYKVGEDKWESTWEEQQVPTTTFDSLINRFGKPFYAKIDVEGFEDHVLAGLHKKIEYLSFEYTAGFGRVFKSCLKHLQRLGYSNYIAFTKERTKLKSIRLTHYQRRDMRTIADLKAFYKTLHGFEQGDLLVY